MPFRFTPAKIATLFTIVHTHNVFPAVTADFFMYFLFSGLLLNRNLPLETALKESDISLFIFCSRIPADRGYAVLLLLNIIYCEIFVVHLNK